MKFATLGRSISTYSLISPMSLLFTVFTYSIQYCIIMFTFEHQQCTVLVDCGHCISSLFPPQFMPHIPCTVGRPIKLPFSLYVGCPKCPCILPYSISTPIYASHTLQAVLSNFHIIFRVSYQTFILSVGCPIKLPYYTQGVLSNFHILCRVSYQTFILFVGCPI